MNHKDVDVITVVLKQKGNGKLRGGGKLLMNLRYDVPVTQLPGLASYLAPYKIKSKTPKL